MNCLLCKKHMYSYYDDELPSKLKPEIDRHLEACTSCHFQYDLTFVENQVLQDTSDIPEISPDFNERVMSAIHSEIQPDLQNNVLVMSKDKRLHLRWSSIYTKSAIAVLLLALCFYVPGFLTGDQQQPKIAQNDQADQIVQKSSAQEFNGITCGSMEKQSTQVIKAPDSSISKSKQSSFKVGNSKSLPDTTQTNMNVTTSQIYAGTRIASREAGRTVRKERPADTLSVSSLSLKNIPEKYKLLSQDNSVANQTNYSYQTYDGSVTINISLISSPAQDQSVVSPTDTSNEITSDRLMMTAAPATAENVSREIQVGGQTISVLLSGNISSDELNNLANNIVICRAPNI